MPSKKQQPEKKDVLEAYPLRIHVNAMPERRFFRMTRTLTITNCLLILLLMILCFVFYYAMDHQDVSIQYTPHRYALFRMNPEQKILERIQPANTTVSAVSLLLEKQLREYIINAHRIVWKSNQQESFYRKEDPPSTIAILSMSSVYRTIVQSQQKAFQKLHQQGLIRDVHLYGLKQLYPGWWRATIDTFDLPIDTRLVSPCPCKDNSPECLQCKTNQAKKRNRYIIWIRTNRKRLQTRNNPLGLSVDTYIPQWIPIHKEEIKWGLPPALRPTL